MAAEGLGVPVMGVAGELGIELVWGGNWDRDQELSDNGFDDLPHFQLASQTRSTRRQPST